MKALSLFDFPLLILSFSVRSEKTFLPPLFDKYIDATYEMVRRGFKECTPLYLLNKVSTIVFLMEALLETVPYDKKASDVIENLFIFCVMWAFGGPMVVDKGGDFRKFFSENFNTTFGQKFPKDRPCFDYMFSVESNEFVEWSSKVSCFLFLNVAVFVLVCRTISEIMLKF